MLYATPYPHYSLLGLGVHRTSSIFVLIYSKRYRCTHPLYLFNPMTTRRKLELTSPPKYMRPIHIVQYARDNPHRFDDELLRQLKFFTREKVAYIIISGFIFSFFLWCICFCYLKSWQNFLQSLVQETKQENNINNRVEIRNNEICYYV